MFNTSLRKFTPNSEAISDIECDLRNFSALREEDVITSPAALTWLIIFLPTPPRSVNLMNKKQ